MICIESIRSESTAINQLFDPKRIPTRQELEKSSIEFETYLRKSTTYKEPEIREKINIHRQELGLPLKKFRPKSIAMTFKDLEQEFSGEINWLWRNHIPYALPCMINGREGVGKTSICLQIAYEILEANKGGSIVWLATEGFVRDTFKKMADLNLTHDNFYIPRKSDNSFRFNLGNKKDISEIDDLLEELPQPILAVFIDSLRGASTFDDNESRVRIPMMALNSIVCDKYKASLVYIHHFKKGQSGDLLDKSSGSPAITASVRQVLSVIRKGNLTRSLKAAKSNIDSDIPDLQVIKIDKKFRIIESKEITEDSLTDKAEAFLIQAFKDSDKLPATQIYADGAIEGITEMPLKSAKKRLDIHAIKDHTTNRWLWYFPT